VFAQGVIIEVDERRPRGPGDPGQNDGGLHRSARAGFDVGLNGAANRDPRQFDDPATFDAARPNARRHIAFGRGIHTCPGAPLARAEARVSIERLLNRTNDIWISEQEHGPATARRYEYLPTFILRGLTELHVEFTLTGEQRQ
jgi:cytochrome P450 family 150 subfamily A5